MNECYMTLFLNFCAAFLTSWVLANTINHQALSQESDAARKYKVIDSPVCFNYLNEPVRSENRKSLGTPIAAGMAMRDETDSPVIFRFNYDISPPAFQKFIDYHECAHHQTGDVDLPHPPRNSPEHLMNESIADCVAILRIKKELEGDQSDYELVIGSLKEAMAILGFPEISMNSRIANIKHCYTSYGLAGTFIRGVLRKRGLP